MLGLVESELGLGFGSVVQTPVAQMIFLQNVWRPCIITRQWCFK